MAQDKSPDIRYKTIEELPQTRETLKARTKMKQTRVPGNETKLAWVKFCFKWSCTQEVRDSYITICITSIPVHLAMGTQLPSISSRNHQRITTLVLLSSGRNIFSFLLFIILRKGNAWQLPSSYKVALLYSFWRQFPHQILQTRARGINTTTATSSAMAEAYRI